MRNLPFYTRNFERVSQNLTMRLIALGGYEFLSLAERRMLVCSLCRLGVIFSEKPTRILCDTVGLHELVAIPSPNLSASCVMKVHDSYTDRYSCELDNTFFNNQQWLDVHVADVLYDAGLTRIVKE